MKAIVIISFRHIGINYNVNDYVVVTEKDKDQYNITKKNDKNIYSTWIKKVYFNAHVTFVN